MKRWCAFLFEWMLSSPHSTPWFRGPPSLSSPQQLTDCILHSMCELSHFSHVRLLVTPWTAAHQAPLSMGILQTRILEWVALPSSRGSPRPRDRTCLMSPELAGGFFSTLTTWEGCILHRHGIFSGVLLPFCFVLSQSSWLS